MRPEQLFTFTPEQRAELDAGFAQILAAQDAHKTRMAIGGALVELADAVEQELSEEGRDAGRAGDAEGASNGSDSAVQGAVPMVRERSPLVRCVLRGAVRYAGRFAGPVTAAVLAGAPVVAVALALAEA
ncbi:hypothetical protein [Streptomyces purpureus]|uniref:Uncharacterized protein n=1 Tax=Streptomyces purpureus TaxID=1951 RepID=A0A918LQ80_9ACTN|nr:hypothetical protein [Streptomyces purpureus]GGT36551.1 hypothetical protein GCM10014713_32840 [Streptomyces purpureus]